jgi:hypothetical protein
MPPAFNLSQDQTLQFDLECFAQNGIEVNFTSVSMSVCDVESCDSRSWQLPSNAHAYRLYVVKEQCLAAR